MPGGRPRKPTNIHKLNGNPSRLNLDARKKTEPDPPAFTARCPSWLSPYGKLEWKNHVPVLKKMRVLTNADAAALAIMCEHLGDFRLYTEEINARRKDGKIDISISDNGYEIQHPWIAMRTNASKMAKLYLASFGFDPAARTKIEVDNGSDSTVVAKPTPRRGVAS